MNKRILTQLIAAATGIVLPVSVFAQDAGQTSTSALEGGAISPGTSSEGVSNSGSFSSGGTFSGDAAPSSENKAGEFVGGIIIHDGSAYVVHKLKNEMALPDGSKVQPNGTVIESDGSRKSLSSGQALSLDGKVVGAPFNGGAATQNSGSGSEGLFNSPNTPGSSTGIGESSGPSEPFATEPATSKPLPEPSPTTDPAAGEPGSGISPTAPSTSTPSESFGGSTSTSPSTPESSGASSSGTDSSASTEQSGESSPSSGSIDAGIPQD